MTSNGDLTERLYHAMRTHDYDAFEGLCDPAIQWIQNTGFPYGGDHHGPAAVFAGVLDRLAAHWDPWRFVIDRIHEAGDTVLVLGTYTGRHRVSGKSVEAATAHVLDWRDGRAWRFRQFTDTAVIRDATV